MKVSADHFGAMKDLIAEGDLNLAEMRAKFAAKTARATTLNDEQLTAAVAMQTDDDDDELVTLIETIEKEGFELDVAAW